MINIFSLAIFSIALAVGQLLFKQTGLAIRGQPLLDAMLSLARQPALYAALTIYAGATLLWVWILSRVPLMQAYPWVAAGMALVPIMAWRVFGERVTPFFWLGVAMILGGIVVTQYAGLPTHDGKDAAVIQKHLLTRSSTL